MRKCPTEAVGRSGCGGARELRESGFEVEATDPDRYAWKIREELRRWGGLARATGIRVG